MSEFFTENKDHAIEYRQLKKNNVPSVKQLEENKCVKFEHTEGKGLRVMFVGNSITRHGVRPEVGWYNDWGMAASSKEQDYVHLLMNNILQNHPDAAFCICQVADWETEYKNGTSKYPQYENARHFHADVIIMRFVENCPHQDFDFDIFRTQLEDFLNFLNPTGNAKLVLSTGFYHHPGDEIIIEYARDKGLPCAYLGDLGEDDAMKAIGKFEHSGVSHHPGDAGMQKIAERIWEKLQQHYSL